jgi:hypothetical protein
MDQDWHSSILKGYGGGFNISVTPPADYNQPQFLAAAYMDRSKLSGSSMDSDSRRSTGSYPDKNCAESPFTPCDSPQSEGGLTPQYSSLSLETVAPSRELGATVTLFNIEKDGDPRINWVMYYDFIVTKNEAYHELQPGYLPTEKYPSRIPSKKMITK